MKDLYIGLGAFAAGVVLTRLYYAKVISIGYALYEKLEGDYEAIVKVIKGL